MPGTVNSFSTIAGSPLYVASDARANNKPGVKFDAVDASVVCPTSVSIRTLFVVAVYPTGPNFTDFSTLFAGGSAYFLRGENGTANWRLVELTASRYRDGVLTDNAGLPGPHVYEVAAPVTYTQSTFRIGDDPAVAVGRHWTDTVFEVIGYNAALTSDERLRVRQYLGGKYAISVV
jgi:hypothetical protein